MADVTDSVSDLQDHGVALSNNNNDFSSDNNSDCGQPTCVGDDDGEELVLEPGMCDPDHMEERFRVDRKKLEEMLQGRVKFVLVMLRLHWNSDYYFLKYIFIVFGRRSLVILCVKSYETDRYKKSQDVRKFLF